MYFSIFCFYFMADKISGFPRIISGWGAGFPSVGAVSQAGIAKH